MTSCLKTLRLTCCDLSIPSQQLNGLFCLIVFFSRSIVFQLIFSMLANNFPNPLCSRRVIVLFHEQNIPARDSFVINLLFARFSIYQILFIS